MIEKELETILFNGADFDVHFNVETYSDGEKVFDLKSIETVCDTTNLMPFLDSRVIENIERLVIAKYVKNQNEARDDD